MNSMNTDKRVEDLVKNLLRFVVRGFYPTQYILMVDCILFHSVLAEEDLAHLLGIKRPDVRALCTKLIEDRLLSSHSQPEFQPGTRGVRRYYYFIKYPEAIDAIKWKIHQLVTVLKEDLQRNSRPQGYLCPVCNTKYSQIDAVALLNYDRTQFICSLCEVPLVEDDSSKKAKEKQAKLSRLMTQVEPIINYLKKIDDSKIEENTFELALTRLIPPQNNSLAYYTVNAKQKRRQDFVKARLREATLSQSAQAVLAAQSATNVVSASVNGVLNNINSRHAGAKSQATLHVNITTASDEQAQKDAQERKAEEKRRQNALPTWHEESTIGKSLGRLDEDDEDYFDSNMNGMNNTGVANSDGNAGSNGNGYYKKNYSDYNKYKEHMQEKEQDKVLSEYYANLAKKNDSDEGGDDEFEDVDNYNYDEDELDEDEYFDDVDDLEGEQAGKEKEKQKEPVAGPSALQGKNEPSPSDVGGSSTSDAETRKQLSEDSTLKETNTDVSVADTETKETKDAAPAEDEEDDFEFEDV